MATVFLSTDHTLRLVGLKDEAGQAVTNAVVTAQILDKAFKPTTAVPFPLTLEDAGEGAYAAQIPDNHGLQRGTQYNLQIDVDKNGVKSRWFEKLDVKRRTF